MSEVAVIDKLLERKKWEAAPKLPPTPIEDLMRLVFYQAGRISPLNLVARKSLTSFD